MADFSVNLQQPQGAGARVLAPVAPAVEYKADIATPLVTLASNLTGIFMQNQKDKEAKEKEALKNQAISSFTQEQTSIANAVEQGMSPSQARALSRANFSKYAANYPQLVSEFKSTNDALFENTGLGEAKKSGEMFKDQQKQLISDMVKVGYPVTESTPPDTFAAWSQAFQASRQADEVLNRSIRINSEMRSANADQRAQFEFNTKQEAGRALAELGGTQLNAAQLFVRDTVAKAKASGNIEGAKLELNNYMSNLQGAIAGIATLHPEMAGNWNKLFNDLKTSADSALTGKENVEALENKLQEIKTKSQLMAMSQPKMQAAYANSALLGGNLAATLNSSSEAARDTVVLIGGVPATDMKVSPPVIGVPDVEKGVYAQLSHQISLLESGKHPSPEAAKTQLSNSVTHIFKQVEQSISNGFSAKDLKSAADFLSSTEYAKLVQSGVITKDQSTMANQVFGLIYNKEIKKGLEIELNKPFDAVPFDSRDKKAIPMSYGSLVDFKWEGAGMSISPSTDKFLNQTANMSRGQIVRETQVASKAINQLVKLGSHLEGHTDYARYWEENKHNILPNNFPDPAVLKPGQSVDGWKYLGGNSQNRNNWMRDNAK